MPAMHSFVVALFGLAALATQSLPAAAQNGPCQRITNACKSAGFIYNSNVPGTGLVIDCIQPIAQNKPQPANAKIPLPNINPQVLEACLAANPSFGQPAAAAAGPDFEEFPVDGESYGWYDDGWSGPGWYIVGSEFRRGVGFGGPEGWRGLKHRGSHPHNAGGRRQGGAPHNAGGGQRRGGGVKPNVTNKTVVNNNVTNRNVGNRNVTNRNVGNRNVGNRNRNVGNRNVGNRNRNVGNRNTGNRHVGGGHPRRFSGGGKTKQKSDIRLKHDIVMLGHLDNGLGFYRFSYNGSDKAYVGVMAQEVQAVMPQAVSTGRDGYLRVDYDRLGFRMETWNAWVASGQKVPAITSQRH